jgi:hypothetical protein
VGGGCTLPQTPPLPRALGMIEGFIDDVINNQYMKEDLKQYLKEEHNIDLFIDNKEIEN